MFLKSHIFKAILFKKPIRLPLSYWLLVFLRLILTVLPQSGYLHPDEFFQNIEIIAGDTLEVDVARTWEFDPKAPIRNIFIPKLILGPPIHVIHKLNPYTKHYFSVDLQTPYYLLVLPRLFICLLSFINDYCLYKICLLYGQNFKNRLNIFASSHVVLVYCCRSFSNSFEMIFFSLLLMLVAKCMYRSDKIIIHDEFLKEKYSKAQTPVEKVKLFKLRSHLPNHSLSNVMTISTLVMFGIFNRPTFIAFAFAPLFFWLYRGLGSKVIGFKDFNYRIFTLMLCFVPSTFILILVDSVYYGYLTSADIESLKISWNSWVVTPLNFLRYNVDKNNLTHHGLHPWWHHVAVNVPLLFNVLGMMAIVTISTNTYRLIRAKYSKLPRIQSITGLMLFSLTIPLLLLSMVPHQEARFVIPILMSLVYLFGSHMYTNESDSSTVKKYKKLMLCTWYILNVFQTVFYGFIHQGGVYPFVVSLHNEIKSSYGTHVHVLSTHTYSVPTYLLQLESTTKIWKNKRTGHKYRLAPSTFIHKYGSLPMKALFLKIDDVLTDAEMMLHEYKKKYKFYVAAPCSLERDIDIMSKRYHYFNLIEEQTYYPHYCTEAIPPFPSRHDQYCLRRVSKNESQILNLNLYDRISCFLKRFCFRVYRVEPVKYV